jgi:hypothetical protein
VEPVKTDKQRRLRRWRGLRVCGERATADSNGRGVGATRGGAATNGQRQPPSWPHPASLPIARGLHSIPSVHRLIPMTPPSHPGRGRRRLRRASPTPFVLLLLRLPRPHFPTHQRHKASRPRCLVPPRPHVSHRAHRGVFTAPAAWSPRRRGRTYRTTLGACSNRTYQTPAGQGRVRLWSLARFWQMAMPTGPGTWMRSRSLRMSTGQWPTGDGVC